MYRILFASSEVYPLIKTGGLGDVAGSLPPALEKLGCAVRILMPAYSAVLKQHTVTHLFDLSIASLQTRVSILQTTLPGSKTRVWLMHHPVFERAGNPYTDAAGNDWHDNALRFALLSHCAALLACHRFSDGWSTDILHCNDWQTALAPALLSLQARRPATVFTIHNLAYQGLFPAETRHALNLPESLWSYHGLEFHGQLSFIKGGLAYADRITTVSPTYATEIQTPEFGNGLDGLLRHRRSVLHGILNGIDDAIWNPARDRLIPARYSVKEFAAKQLNKTALQRQCGMKIDAEIPVIGMVSRLVEQKGLDMVLQALPFLMQMPLQIIVLGSGHPHFEKALQKLSSQHPDRLHVHLGYNETLAHCIEAGADIFPDAITLEPCGLNQLYSLRYGTVPVVHRTGGLADTVIDVGPGKRPRKGATGFAFAPATSSAMLASLSQALRLFQDKPAWEKLAREGMRQNHSWKHSAQEYLHLYRALMQSDAPAV